MNKRFLLVLLVFFFAGGFSVVAAQKTHLQTAKDLPDTITVGPGYKGPPFFTYTGEFYGYVTDNKDLRKGYDATADEIRKSVAGGARYVLYNNVAGRLDLEPQGKAAEFAGQQVWIRGTVTSNVYGSGATSDPSIDGYGAGDGTVATRFRGLQITKITPTVRDDAYADYKEPRTSGAGIDADQLQQEKSYGLENSNSK